MDTQPLAESIRNIPPVTRFFTMSTVAVCLGNALNIIRPDQLRCNLWFFVSGYSYVKLIITGRPFIFDGLTALLGAILQCYRCFSCFLLPAGIPGSPFGAIMDIYFFYTFANHVERIKFRGSFPDCLWFSFVTGTIILIITLLYNYFDMAYMPRHHSMMLSCITYIWSRENKNSTINFAGILPIKGYHLPLFNLFFKLIVEGYWACFDSFIGIVGGYLYQCMQSGTLPIYNLFPQFYPQFYPRNNQVNKVGTIRVKSTTDDIITDSIFDKGYLRAPLWLYKQLDYPVNERKPDPSSFRGKGGNVADDSVTSATTTGWFGNNAFKGKGHRLGS